MVTGDHPATATAIADEVGLRTPDAPVHLGSDLPTDDQHLGAILDRDGVVIARVSPEDKLRIARALHARGHVVAMTGDGVNDAPALHEADIGVAMGRSGTDVARDAADLVLLDDSFASIVAGIEQGRATYINVRRFLTYHLTDNVAELAPFVVWALSGGQFPLALGVLQILALDLGTDTFSAVALGAEPPAKHLLDGPPVSGRLMNGTVLRRAFGVLGPLEAFLGMTAFLVSLMSFGWMPGHAFPTGDELLAVIRRGLHHRRLRPGGECLRLPLLDALAGVARMALESAPSLGGRSRDRVLPPDAVGASGRGPPRSIQSAARRLGGRVHRDTDPPRGRRTGQAPPSTTGRPAGHLGSVDPDGMTRARGPASGLRHERCRADAPPSAGVGSGP